jgi:hypothetical protein
MEAADDHVKTVGAEVNGCKGAGVAYTAHRLSVEITQRRGGIVPEACRPCNKNRSVCGAAAKTGREDKD